MNGTATTGGGRKMTIRKRTASLRNWTIAWVVSMALAVFGPKFLWPAVDWLTVMAIGINLMIGVGMIAANKHYLMSLDELQQKIYLEAMGLTLGVGLVAGLAYSNLDVTGIIPFDAEISHLVILMGLTCLVSIVLLNRHYR